MLGILVTLLGSLLIALPCLPLSGFNSPTEKGLTLPRLHKAVWKTEYG